MEVNIIPAIGDSFITDGTGFKYHNNKREKWSVETDALGFAVPYTTEDSRWVRVSSGYYTWRYTLTNEDLSSLSKIIYGNYIGDVNFALLNNTIALVPVQYTTSQSGFYSLAYSYTDRTIATTTTPPKFTIQNTTTTYSFSDYYDGKFNKIDDNNIQTYWGLRSLSGGKQITLRQPTTITVKKTRASSSESIAVSYDEVPGTLKLTFE